MFYVTGNDPIGLIYKKDLFGFHLQDKSYMQYLHQDNPAINALELSVLERTQITQKKPVDLMQLFCEAFAQYAPQLESRHIALRTDGECRTQADPRMMAQTALNLFSVEIRFHGK